MDRTDRSPRRRTLLPVLILAGSLVASGCATVGFDRGKPLVPTGYQTRTGPFLVCTNNRLDPDSTVVRQLNALETQISETLGLRVDPGDEPIEIYLLDDRPAFDHFLQCYYPDLPRRRAFFLANGRKRVVYTFLGDRTAEDVRHEATHALLHVALGDIPLWLDEGLAEYFEGTSSQPGTVGGVNAEHLDRLPLDLAAGWSPDLHRLETLRSVREMSPRDYRESWAWIHYLLNDSRPHKAALLAYLGDLRTDPNPRPISDRLGPTNPAPILTHLSRIRERPVASAVAPRDPTIRLQSGSPDLAAASSGVGDPPRASPTTTATAAEPAPAAPNGRRRSLLSRVFGWIGS